MSYDLDVYGGAITLGEMREALVSADLEVEQVGEGSFCVSRGKRRRYSFTVGLPAGVEPEDVPEDVTAVVLGANCLVEILVEGSAASEIPHAVRAARRLAAAMDGAVHDRQLDEVFRRGHRRISRPVERGVVSIVEMKWYVRSREGVPGDAARAFVAAARRFLPEALPRRYGTFEPLQRHWDAGGEESFVEFVGSADDTVYLKGKGPVIGGHIGGDNRDYAVVHSHALSVLAEPLHDERWREAVVRMFSELAQELDAIHATAEVVRGLEWSGRTLWYGGQAERTEYLAGGGSWKGLTPHPVWLSWFGKEYAPIIKQQLPPNAITSLRDGLLCRLAESPLSRDDLWDALKPHDEPTQVSPRRSWLGLRRPKGRIDSEQHSLRQTWLSPEYLAVPESSDPRIHSAPHPANNIPEALK